MTAFSFLVFSVRRTRSRHRRWRSQGFGDMFTNKHFRGFAGNGKSSKISKLVQVCIACQFVIPLIVVNNSENVHSKLIVSYGQTKYNIQKSCLTAEKSKKLD